MTLKIRSQLSVMMFLEYFVWGCWYVTMSTYLGQTLGFSGVQIGLAYSTFAISAMISPFFVGLIADRYFASERVLGVLHLVGAILLFGISKAQTFGNFYTLILLYNLCYTPTIALSNSVSFNQMSDPGVQFPSIRVLGTIGWIIAGLTIGFLAIEASASFFVIASASSLVLGLYCFSLPHMPPKKGEKALGFGEILGLDALNLFKQRDFAVLITSSVLISIPLMFYYGFTNLFFNETGMENAAGKMTMGQMSEIIFLLIMPFFFRRLGVKKMILIGMLAWVFRYLLFASGNNDQLVWMFYLGIILHGICYDFFFVTGQIFVDRRAPAHQRSSAQGIITFATYGLGFFIGTLVSGQVVDYYAIDAGVHNWKGVWMVPAIFAMLVMIIFGLLFRERKSQTSEK